MDARAKIVGVQTSFRIEWTTIPAEVRASIEAMLGAPVVEAVNQTGGYSPSLAARCRLADGRRVFLKAGADAPSMNPVVPWMLRREADLGRRWTGDFPAPRLVATHDDGDWVAVAFEDIAGRTPPQPWRDDDLGRVLEALDDLPTPDDLPLGLAEERMAGAFGGFVQLLAAPAPRDEWTAANLAHLAGIEAAWPDAVRGDQLVHGDVRDDNVLSTDDGRVLLVDWAHATIGAGWLDVALAAPSIELGGGPPCEELVARSRRASAADPAHVTTVAVALLGYFTRQVGLPPPPGVPAVRAFQEAQRRVAQRWVRSLLG